MFPATIVKFVYDCLVSIFRNLVWSGKNYGCLHVGYFIQGFQARRMIGVRDSNPLYRLEKSGKIKSRTKLVDFLSVMISWLGIREFFQTFEDDEKRENINHDVQLICQLLDEDRE
jgi:hypothetical protein